MPVYAAVVGAKAWFYGRGWLPVRRLARPVVSVGSLSAGGAGKTPVVIALAELLTRQGWAVDVLSRGYGRSGRGVERVDAAAAGSAEEAAARFGDEPVLIAQRAGVPVWVGADRWAAGRAAEAAGDPSTGARAVHLLDDGLQHRRLARVMDVVVVTDEDLEDVLLPAGNLREPLRALRRAHAIVVRAEEMARISERLRAVAGEETAIWQLTRGLQLDPPAGGGPQIAFCGIARPGGFTEMLENAGDGVVETVAFDDHHAYAVSDMEQLIRVARARGATGFVTTEKDRVKLTRPMLERLRTVGPVRVARLDARFVEEAAVVRALEACCG